MRWVSVFETECGGPLMPLSVETVPGDNVFEDRKIKIWELCQIHKARSVFRTSDGEGDCC